MNGKSNEESRMNGIEAEIFNREISSLKVAVIFRLIGWGYLAGIEPISAKSLMELAFVEILMFFGIMISVMSLFFFVRKMHVRPLGIAGSILDVIIVTLQPVIWYFSVGGVAVNPAFMLKGPLYQTFLWLILGYNSFALQPVYIIIVLIGGSLGYIAHFAYLVFSHRAEFTTSYIAHNLGGGVDISSVLQPLIAYIAIGVGFVIFSMRMKGTIYTAVRNEMTSNQLSRFFSPKVRDAIMSLNEQDASEKGKLQDVAVMFTDIRNFTKYCEDKSPDEIVSFLKAYQSIMVEIIFKYNGTLDKFVGDGIMATFGTPSTSEDDASNAVKAAIEMSSSLKNFNIERTNAGLAKIAIGIGIHFGQVVVGTIGSANRLEYTVIGDTVNIASRLEAATKELKREIVFSQEVRDHIAEDIKTVLLGSIEIRGHGIPMQVYSL